MNKDKNIEQMVQKSIWKANLTKEDKAKFASYMKELNKFCKDNNIKNSTATNFVFKVNNVNYMITNDSDTFNYIKTRLRIADITADGLKIDQIFYASKFRVIDIFKDIQAGKKLDYRGKETVQKEQENNQVLQM